MTTLEDFPALVLERIIEFLDYESRRTCRLVSKKLKAYVNFVGLSIMLDTRETVSTDLSKSKNVVTTEVRIIHLDLESYDPEADAVRNWKTAILSAPLDFSWLNDHIFKNCSNLRVLILNGDALTAKEFVGQPELNQCFHLLSELHITLNEVGFQDGLGRLNPAYKNMVEDSQEYFEIYRTLMARIHKNLAYLFKITRSRALKLLFISVHGLDFTAGEIDCWKYQPLFEFLQKHGHSLDTIILPTIAFSEPREEIEKTLMNPIQLKRIRLATNCNLLPNGISKYWLNLLLHQVSLENLSVCITRHPANEEPFPWLPAVVAHNAITLTDICLSLQLHFGLNNADAEFQGMLDMRMFLITEALQNLKIIGPWKHELKILNLNELPIKCLTKLILFSVKIEADFDGIKFLESFNPSHLSLSKVSDDGHFKDPLYTFRFIQLALRCRALDEFECNTTNSLFIPISVVGESRLEPWLTQLDLDERLPNIVRFGMIYRFTDLDPETSEDYPDQWTLSRNELNYMDMMDVVEFEDDGVYREPVSYRRLPPYFLPRNMDSFSVWTNAHTSFYRILPNTKSQSMRFNDMRQFSIVLRAVPNGDDVLIKPVSMSDIDVSKYVNKNGTSFCFESEDLSNFRLPNPN